ncbi:MAG: uncharacterized protein JWM59_1006 [Verrucomicrobiales bacterium]|nr:uncharacterized protein [Verrucomicrobiales bacterium]
MPQKSKKSQVPAQGSRKTFKAAVMAVPDMAGNFRNGVQALAESHRKGLKNMQLATGSLDLDAALAASRPNDHRWDYGIGLPFSAGAEKVLWLEVHYAASGETERVIKKLTALKSWLQSNAEALQALPRIYVWQLSNVERSPNDRRKRNALAEKHGLQRVQGVLDLATL